LLLPLPCFELIWVCSRAPIEKKNYTRSKFINFYIFKKVSKNKDKNSARRYLPEISFVPQRDNGPLGVKREVKQFDFSLKILQNMHCKQHDL